jgi:2OG-Fe(II) oxygenase superfamily
VCTDYCVCVCVLPSPFSQHDATSLNMSSSPGTFSLKAVLLEIGHAVQASKYAAELFIALYKAGFRDVSDLDTDTQSDTDTDSDTQNSWRAIARHTQTPDVIINELTTYIDDYRRRQQAASTFANRGVDVQSYTEATVGDLECDTKLLDSIEAIVAADAAYAADAVDAAYARRSGPDGTGQLSHQICDRNSAPFHIFRPDNVLQKRISATLHCIMNQYGADSKRKPEQPTVRNLHGVWHVSGSLSIFEQLQLVRDCLIVGDNVQPSRPPHNTALFHFQLPSDDELSAAATTLRGMFDRAVALVETVTSECTSDTSLGNAIRSSPLRTMRAIMYPPGGLLPMHLDAAEMGWVLGISLGASADFSFVDTQGTTQVVRLNSGDFALFEGDVVKHGITAIHSNSIPTWFSHLVPYFERINIQWRPHTSSPCDN